MCFEFWHIIPRVRRWTLLKILLKWRTPPSLYATDFTAEWLQNSTAHIGDLMKTKFPEAF